MSTRINSIRDLAASARGRRQRLGLSQAELAGRAGVSRTWLSEFEACKPTAELGLVIRLFDALGLRLVVDEGDRPADDRPESTAAVDLDALLDDYRQP
jgi:transcriptional regulator with XRE-family HTH domain